MTQYELVMPKLGESIIEATITKWLKKLNDNIEIDDSIAEIATDKVDSEIPCPVSGKLIKILYNEGDVVAIGKVIAIIETSDNDNNSDNNEIKSFKSDDNKTITDVVVSKEVDIKEEKSDLKSDKFYSPLVKSIAKKENISIEELDAVVGTGKDNRLTKEDILNYISSRNIEVSASKDKKIDKASVQTNISATDEIVEMDRMRKLIADHMVYSKHTSPHVTSFVEVDVSNMVQWRNTVKDAFEQKEKEKITFTPIFIEIVAQTLREFPMINASVNGNKIILKKNINIGMAAALPNGNLIVPVIKNADQKSLLGIVKNLNDLANRARINKLSPDEIQDGTFTITNLGSFGTLTGTPVINQPQVAILAIGSIKKRPVVIESEHGDVIAIRSTAYLSMSYDHRIVDGALAGKFLSRLTQLIENFDVKRKI